MRWFCRKGRDAGELAALAAVEMDRGSAPRRCEGGPGSPRADFSEGAGAVPAGRRKISGSYPAGVVDVLRPAEPAAGGSGEGDQRAFAEGYYGRKDRSHD